MATNTKNSPLSRAAASAPNFGQHTNPLTPVSVHGSGRFDGTISSPYIIGSDSDEDEDGAFVPASRVKRTKLADDVQVVEEIDSDTSDDKPLLDRLEKWKAMKHAEAQKSGAGEVFVSTSSSSASLRTDSRSVHNRGSNTSEDGRFHSGLATPKSLKGLTYGKRANLTPTFKDIRSVATEASSRTSTIADTPTYPRRVPTPDRLITNMRLKDLNNLVVSMGRIEKKKTSRVARAKKPVNAKTKLNDRTKAGAKAFEESKVDMLDSNISQSGVYAARKDGDQIKMSDDNLDKAMVDPVDYSDHEEYSSEGTLAADSEDELISPATAKEMRMSRLVRRTKAAPGRRRLFNGFALPGSTPRIGRVARETPASDIIDLTNEELASTPVLLLPPQETSSLAHQLFPKSPSPPLSTEKTEYTLDREKIFMKAFSTHWWAGGFSVSGAIKTVNTGLPAQTLPFGEEEGKRRLQSLSSQGKLALQNNTVYHLYQSPHVIATPKVVKNVHISPSQQLARDLRHADSYTYRSPLGKISEKRYQKFDMLFYPAVMITKTLFKDGREETVDKCMEVVNEWMNEGHEFSAKEAEAALAHLAKLGNVIFDSDKKVVKLVSLE
ncbi:hypothetical protein OPT61_g7414 [Boeremia exigua]|uniref:Uncharacterized protein n=1 Tax=Boeremia exigua TaxID=749465 RepID=A0ACC2I3B4_9PLEO|nr:hypothetical protein OPT61_g7414 [Boeremia exigua]